jgi:tryptophan synthase alpha chain
MPIGLLVYANLVIGRTPEAFYRRAREAGVDSVLAADVPSLMAAPFAECAAAAGIEPVFIVPPNASDAKLREIAGLTKGYTYFLGRSGVTGADRAMTVPLSSRVRLLADAGAPPVVVGFGISKPEHVRAAIEAGAAGAISGSATVAIIARHIGDEKKMRGELANFISGMKSATRAVFIKQS